MNYNSCIVKCIIIAVFSIYSSLSVAQTVGIRAGVGQFASQAEEIDGSSGNSFLAGISLNPKPTFRIDIGFRYNQTGEAEVSTIPAMTSLYTVEKIRRKIGYSAVYAAPGLNIDLSSIGSGIGAYVYGGAGVSFSTVVNKIEYSETGVSSTYMLEQTDRDSWKFFWLLGAGAKVQVFYLGVFGEFSYYDGNAMEYNAVTVSDVEILSSGTVEPRGFAAYVGICWN